MKLQINWDDMKCIIDDVEYKLDEFTIDPYNTNLKGYIEDYYPSSTFYRKDNIVLEYYYGYYSLFKLGEDDNIIARFKIL